MFVTANSLCLHKQAIDIDLLEYKVNKQTRTFRNANTWKIAGYNKRHPCKMQNHCGGWLGLLPQLLVSDLATATLTQMQSHVLSNNCKVQEPCFIATAELTSSINPFRYTSWPCLNKTVHFRNLCSILGLYEFYLILCNCRFQSMLQGHISFFNIVSRLCGLIGFYQ